MINSKNITALLILLTSLGSNAELNPVSKGLIEGSCAADELPIEEKDNNGEFVFENDPYQLKKIHFELLVMDLNDDGELTESEIKKINPSMLGYWNKYDINKDGVIIGEEVKNYIEILLKDRWRRKFMSLDRLRRGHITKSDLERIYYAYPDIINVDDIMESYDTDSDGKITIIEYMQVSEQRIRDSNLTL